MKSMIKPILIVAVMVAVYFLIATENDSHNSIAIPEEHTSNQTAIEESDTSLSTDNEDDSLESSYDSDTVEHSSSEDEHFDEEETTDEAFDSDENFTSEDDVEQEQLIDEEQTVDEEQFIDEEQTLDDEPLIDEQLDSEIVEEVVLKDTVSEPTENGNDSIDDLLIDEPIDQEWAAEVENSIADIFTDSDNFITLSESGLDYSYSECRTTVCQVQFIPTIDLDEKTSRDQIQSITSFLSRDGTLQTAQLSTEYSVDGLLVAKLQFKR